MKIVADLHTHTNVSHHAFSSFKENILAAKKCGLKAIGISDHAPALPDGAHPWHFESMIINVPRVIEGVTVLRGVECNILEPDGRVDLENYLLSKLDYSIASVHSATCLEHDPKKLTSMLLNIMENPRINFLGHTGDPQFAFNYEEVISKCNKYNTAIEINNNSFSARKGSNLNCLKIALLCKKYDVPVVINSDAHIEYQIGQFDSAFDIIEQAQFPEELIINADFDRLKKYLFDVNGVDITK